MKRLFCTFLILFLMIPLFGCSLDSKAQEKLTFYYRRTNFLYGEEDSVIASEQRDISGHAGDIAYTISLYLVGPLDEELTCLFPRNTRVLSVEEAEGTLRIELSDIRDTLSDSEFALACACLTLTCLDMTDAENVTIISAERSVTMNRDSLTLYDSSTPAETTNGG